MPKKGFTLIELLVVIAIIALLLLIVIPALKSARIQAQGVVCVSNINSLLKAYLAYASVNDEKLVNGNVPRYLTQGADISASSKEYWVQPPQNEQWQYTGEPSGPPVLREKQLGIMRGALFSYVGDVKTYHCPGDLSRKFVPNKDNLFPDNYAYRSYSVSDFLNGWVNDRRAVKKITEIVSPGIKYVFLGTTDKRGWNMGSWNFDLDSKPPRSDTVAVWHRDRSGFGFADGHGVLHKWEDEYVIQAADDPAVNWFEYKDPFSKDLEFLRVGYVPGLRKN